jgi:hypothetical protein
MKKILFILLVFWGLTTNAQININLFTEEGEKFVLFLNGIQQNNVAVSNIKVENINANVQKIRLVFDNKEIQDINQNLYYEKNREYTYVIRNKNKKTLSIDNQKVKSYTYVVKLLDVKPLVTKKQTKVWPDEPANIEHDTTNKSESNTKIYTQNNGNEKTAIKNEELICAPMSVNILTDLIKQLKAQSFEDNKIKIVKQVLTNNCVSTAQVKKLMSEFNFDSNKLKIAKLCYAKTTDKSNYFTLNDAFIHSFTAEDLNDFIKNNGTLSEEDLED